jgi:hypothetical protein
MAPMWMVTLELALNLFMLERKYLTAVHIYLGTLASAFQAELYAITQTCLDIAKFLDDNCPFTFYIDYQTTLLALDSPLTTSVVVQDCIDSLNKLGSIL